MVVRKSEILRSFGEKVESQFFDLLGELYWYLIFLKYITAEFVFFLKEG